VQETCAKMGIQLHEHMRVPRQSMAGGLGIDAPPADLKVPCPSLPWQFTGTAAPAVTAGCCAVVAGAVAGGGVWAIGGACRASEAWR
jgi:hypothetical protein